MLRKKTAVVATGLALTLATAAIAFAYWTNSGTGTGSAASGDNSSIVVHQTSAITGLYPGGDPVTLSGNFDNGNAGKVQVHQVTASLASVVGGSEAGKPACKTTDFALTDNPATVDSEIDPGSGVGGWTGIKLQLLDTGANQDNCKNATVNISYASN